MFMLKFNHGNWLGAGISISIAHDHLLTMNLSVPFVAVWLELGQVRSAGWSKRLAAWWLRQSLGLDTAQVSVDTRDYMICVETAADIRDDVLMTAKVLWMCLHASNTVDGTGWTSHLILRPYQPAVAVSR